MGEHRYIVDTISNINVRSGRKLLDLIGEDLRNLFFTQYFKQIGLLVREFEDTIHTDHGKEGFHEKLKYILKKENYNFLEVIRHDEIFD